MAPRRRSSASSNWGGPKAALAAILGVAAALRLVGIEYGLPFGTLLNPDEQSLVPRAWRMVHGAGPDPRWFEWPTLAMYLQAPLQAFYDAPSILTARLVVVALGLATVVAAFELGRLAYGEIAGAIAAAAVAVETTHVAYSHMAVTDVPLTLGVTVSLALLIAGRLEVAGLAAGLTASAKYPGALLLVPLAVAAWRQWRRLFTAVVLAAAGFVAGSPFIAAHPVLAWHDATRVGRLQRRGWLGFEHDHFSLFAFTGRLWNGVGPVLLIAVVGLGVALVRRRRADLVLASFALAYAVSLLPLRSHFDRYLLPLVPVLGVLAGRMRALAPVTLLLLVVPLTWSIRDDIRLTRTDTRVVAERWIRAHVPEESTIAVESSTPALPAYPTLPLALPGPGRPFDPNRDTGRLRARGVKFVLVTGAVADRVLRARDRYAREARFYGQLRTSATRLYYVTPGHGLSGPWVAVYRL